MAAEHDARVAEIHRSPGGLRYGNDTLAVFRLLSDRREPVIADRTFEKVERNDTPKYTEYTFRVKQCKLRTRQCMVREYHTVQVRVPKKKPAACLSILVVCEDCGSHKSLSFNALTRIKKDQQGTKEWFESQAYVSACRWRAITAALPLSKVQLITKYIGRVEKNALRQLLRIVIKDVTLSEFTARIQRLVPAHLVPGTVQWTWNNQISVSGYPITEPDPTRKPRQRNPRRFNTTNARLPLYTKKQKFAMWLQNTHPQVAKKLELIDLYKEQEGIKISTTMLYDVVKQMPLYRRL